MSEQILLELNSQEEARFWAKVQKAAANQCWPWIAKSKAHGYGLWRVRKILYRAHRVAYILSTGNLPGPLDVRHSCHVTDCCNPAHLSPGTRKQNMQDSVRAGRTKGIRVGSKNGYARLDEAVVREIKQMLKDGMRHIDIAKATEISRPTVTRINTGHIWDHVTI